MGLGYYIDYLTSQQQPPATEPLDQQQSINGIDTSDIAAISLKTSERELAAHTRLQNGAAATVVSDGSHTDTAAAGDTEQCTTADPCVSNCEGNGDPTALTELTAEQESQDESGDTCRDDRSAAETTSKDERHYWGQALQYLEKSADVLPGVLSTAQSNLEPSPSSRPLSSVPTGAFTPQSRCEYAVPFHVQNDYSAPLPEAASLSLHPCLTPCTIQVPLRGAGQAGTLGQRNMNCI